MSKYFWAVMCMFFLFLSIFQAWQLGQRQVRNEAVYMGHAKWSVDADNNLKFQWNLLESELYNNE
jgi:hypothetical protein